MADFNKVIIPGWSLMHAVSLMEDPTLARRTRLEKAFQVFDTDNSGTRRAHLNL